MSVALGPDLTRLTALGLVLGATIAFAVLVRLGVGVATLLTPSTTLASNRAEASRRILGSAIGQTLTVTLVAALLLRAGLNLGDLGFTRGATPQVWAAAGLLAALTTALVSAGPLRGSATQRELSAYRVSGGLLAGLAAGFGEEIVFRGFVMTALAWGGFAPGVQVAVSALLFGVVHAGWGMLGARVSLRMLLGATVATGAVGALYGLLYVWGGRSLLPLIAAHTLTDLLTQPALLEVMIARQRLGRDEPSA